LAVDYYGGGKGEWGAKWAIELADILATSWHVGNGGLLVSVLRGRIAELGWRI
jgi:hypothetical protein